MSAPVDVLAVMGLASDVLHDCHKHHKSPAGQKLDAARAAVAELIEAAGTYEEAVRLFGRTSPSAGRAYDFLCSALARVQGGAK